MLTDIAGKIAPPSGSVAVIASPIRTEAPWTGRPSWSITALEAVFADTEPVVSTTVATASGTSRESTSRPTRDLSAMVRARPVGIRGAIAAVALRALVVGDGEALERGRLVQRRRQQCVAQGNARVGEGPGIEDEAVDARGALDAFDEFVLGVRLVAVELMAQFFGELDGCCFGGLYAYDYLSYTSFRANACNPSTRTEPSSWPSSSRAVSPQ